MVVHSKIQYSLFETVYSFNPPTPLNVLSLFNHSLLKHKDGKTKVDFVKKSHAKVKLQIEKKNESYIKYALKVRIKWCLNPKTEFGSI